MVGFAEGFGDGGGEEEVIVCGFGLEGDLGS